MLWERKLVIQGKYSFMVALPKDFCRLHKWKKGDVIVIREDGERLVLERKKGDEHVS